MAWSTKEQLRALRTDAQRAAILREGQIIDEKYPGQYVAYIDDWTGDELVRTVVAAAVEFGEFQDRLAKLAPDVRARIQLTQTPPPDVIGAPSLWFT